MGEVFRSEALTRRSHTHGSDNSIYSAPGIITNFIIISFAINRWKVRCAKWDAAEGCCVYGCGASAGANCRTLFKYETFISRFIGE